MLAGREDIALLQKNTKAIRQFRDLYPGLLTIALFAIFGASIINGIRLSREPNARYWVGETGYAVLAIPVIVIIAHIVQSYYRRPLYFCLIFSCAFPPLICFFTGYSYQMGVGPIVDRLLSTDCTTFERKFYIEQAYKAATTFFNDCLATQAKNQSVEAEAIRKNMVISQCPGYNPEAAGYAKEWAYLQQLEQHEHCAGWCFVGEGALWTHNPTDWDSCSAAAGVTMKNTVARNAGRMMTNGVIGFLIAVIIIFFVNEWLTRTDDPSLHW